MNRQPARHATEVARDLAKLADFIPMHSELIAEACSELNRQAAVIAEVKAAFRT